MYQYERKGKEGGLNNRSNAVQLAKKGADSKWEGILQLAGKKRYRGSQDVDDSDEEDERSVKKQRTRKDVSEDEEEEEESSSEDDSGDDYEEKQTTARPRYTFSESKVDSVIKSSGHERKNYDKNKFEAVYTCPACRRPMASIKKNATKLDRVPFTYLSKKNKHKKTQRAAVLDHYPPWAGRYDELKAEGADERTIREDHNDEAGLRALCKKCNESHKYEKQMTIDYESGTDESGYDTQPDEDLNSGVHAPFKYHKDDEDENGTGGSGAGITA